MNDAEDYGHAGPALATSGIARGSAPQRLQRIGNRDHGPVWIESLRLQMEFGVKPRGAK